MDKLSELKPLKKLVLPGVGELNCSGLTVIVGPNSSGKSKLLRDLKHKMSGEPKELVVAQEIDLSRPDPKELIKLLKAEGHIYSTWDDNDQEQYIPATTAIGTGQGAKNIASNQLDSWHSKSSALSKGKRTDEYYDWLSKFLVTALFLENRLTSLTSVGTIDFESNPPTHDLHALHLNDEARARLSDEITRAFSKAIWTDISRGNRLCLRISDEGAVPSAENRHSVKEMAKYRTIEDEGDGMKSYVATAISVLLGRRPVCLIDEPEMCLHPPQAYNLGQFLGASGTGPDTATFVATHSSHILRGMIQRAEKLQIVRLTRKDEQFHAKRVESDVLSEAMRKPTVRAETVLDGIFSQAVAIVEADGDRIVYQAAWEAAGKSRNFDIHFTTAGGTGGIADTCQLYRVLGIPVAVVTDLDLIADDQKLSRILEAMCGEAQVTVRIQEGAEGIVNALKELPPTMTESEARKRLAEIVYPKDGDWKKGKDQIMRKELQALTTELRKMQRLKSGGIAALPKELESGLQAVIDQCANIGLFLVPVGELEYWLQGRGISASKKTKWAWANEAAQYIHLSETEDNDIWKFIGQVGRFLESQFG